MQENFRQVIGLVWGSIMRGAVEIKNKTTSTARLKKLVACDQWCCMQWSFSTLHHIRQKTSDGPSQHGASVHPLFKRYPRAE